MRGPPRHAILPLAAALLAAGCGFEVSARPAAQIQLREKRGFQALYAADGRLMRLLQDKNGDRRADAIVIFYPLTGRPQLAEIDTDLDGIVDRWEFYSESGRLARVALGSGRTGRPETWIEAP